MTPGLLPIPPNGWGAIEKIIWEYHLEAQKLGHHSEIRYLGQVDDSFDIVHIHAANLGIMAYNDGMPYVFSCHDHHTYVYGKDSHVYKENLEAMEKSELSFVPGRFLIPYFQNTPTLKYLGHGVNCDFFTPAETLPSSHRLLCVANNGLAADRGYDRKGFIYAIQAAKVLGLPITIVGPRNNENFLNSHNIHYDKLEIVFDATEDELKRIYREHTIFLHPSILEAGHPNLTLLEAMASGLPVVGTLEPQTNLKGLYKAERNVSQIVDGIKHVISDYDTIRNDAISTAREHSFANVTKRMIDMYETAIQSRNQVTTNEIMEKQLLRIYSETPIAIREEIKQQNIINCQFIKGATVEILGSEEASYLVQFIDRTKNELVYETVIKNNHWCKPAREYFADWHIKVYKENTLIAEHVLNLKDRKVYIALESSSIGDTLAWFPAVVAFKEKHGCKLVVSTFRNEWFAPMYPDIEFVKAGDPVHNLYAMYCVGWYYNESKEVDFSRVPLDFKTHPLQDTASKILGLECLERKPKLYVQDTSRSIEEKYVIISPHASAHAKYWNRPKGWQMLADHLNAKGYKVVMMTLEKLGDPWHDSKLGGTLTGVIDKTGEISLQERMKDILNAELLIGVGSGLPWMAWALGTKTVLISGFSYPYTEFREGVRIFNDAPNLCTGCFNRHKLDPSDWEWCPDQKGTPRQFECTRTISAEQVIREVNKALGLV